MKKSESILLIATVGLGVVLAASQLPGKGRGGSIQVATGGSKAAMGGPQAAWRQGVTLELLVAKRAPLTPLPPTLRNPFRPVSERGVTDELGVGIRVTAIFGDGEGGDERLSALVRGSLIKADDAGVATVWVKRSEAGLPELLHGKRVRQGDTIGPLRVVYVGRRGVVLLYEGEQIPLKLHAQGADGAGSGAGRGSDSSGTRPTGTDTENPLRVE